MENNNKRNKIVTLTVIGIIVLLIVLVGATYAYFSARSKADTQTINTAKVDLLVEIDEKATHIENIKPTVWYHEGINRIQAINNFNNEDIVMIPIKVTNNSTIDVNFDLNLQAKNLELKSGTDEDGNELIGGTTSDIKYRLLSGTVGNRSFLVLTNGDFTNPEYKHILLYNQSLKKDQSKNYILFIYIADTEEEQNKLQGITFDVEISANTTNPTSRAGEKLADAIKKDYEIIDRKPSYKTYPVYDNSSNLIKENTFFLEDNGLFKLQNSSGNNIYYFRGENKYVLFGKFKEGDLEGVSIGWNILRINADGSVTLLFDGEYYEGITESTAYSEDGSTKYEGSKVKEVLEEWYNKTFSKEEKEMIQETEFCNDTDHDAVLKRLNKDNPEPTLECSDGHKVNAYIGLPTADEVIFSGGALYGKGVFSSVYENGTWTMTATSENAMAYANSKGLYSSETTNNFRVQPIITIKPNTKLLDSVTDIYDTYKSDYEMYVIGAEE